MPRVVTYNVHRCLGSDGRLSPVRIARVLAECKPDIVALQELDVGRARSGGVDQAMEIAAELGMRMHFHPALRVEEELYGDAVLTQQPMQLVKAGALPGHPRHARIEARGALWVRIDLDGGPINLINTHLGLYPRERIAQIEALLGPDWLMDARCDDRILLAGDFNATPQSSAYRRLTGRLSDAYRQAGRGRRCTFPAYLPMLRIDYIFAGRGLGVTHSEVRRSRLSRAASDHLPLIVDFELAERAAPFERAQTGRESLCPAG